LREICASGVGAIIVDRDVRRLAQIAGRAVVLFRGEVVFDGTPGTLLADNALMAKYIGL
jgi:ABC-type lipopolysaccharide export system ATPase subunit